MLIATGFFAYQIYCDFSGYSDIAIGSAKILGISLMENFNRPYFSTSIKEFWSRWHISLSRWFRDYVYIPLGGSKKGLNRTYVNILLVFLISGLWHGASWTFVIWGAIHGLYQLYERLTFSLREQIWKLINLDGTQLQWFIKWSITMGVVLMSWVFFRATSLEEVFRIVSLIADDIIDGGIIKQFISLFQFNPIGFGIGLFRVFAVILSILVLELFQILEEINIVENRLITELKTSISFWLIFLLGNFGLQEFIYFQF
jgi:hypothetical protein